MQDAHFYDHMTGELTELGRRFGFPENMEENPGQYAQAWQRYKDSLNDDVHLIYHHEDSNNNSFDDLGKYEVSHDDEKYEVTDDGKVFIQEITAHEHMYELATRQCNVLRSAIQHPDCDADTRQTLISMVKNILNSFSNTDEIKKMKEQIYIENPDFFPREAALVNAKNQLRPHLERLKSEIQLRRSRPIRPQDRISGVVAGDRIADGIRMGIIDQPKNVRSANRQADQIRKRLGLMLERRRNGF